MEYRDRASYQALQLPTAYPSPGATLGYSILALYLVHQALAYFDYPILSLPELVWNALVYFVPARLLLDSERQQQLREQGGLSQMQAAKSEALRRMILGGGALSHKLNSVLQGLASLGSLTGYLQRAGVDSESTSVSLQDTIAKLNDASNNGKQLWTPAKLKSMSSWQQQDAQEYFSKIMDDLDKEAARAIAAEKAKPGLEGVVHEVSANGQREDSTTVRNPLEGLLAQRVACTRCGFSEGLSMIPFNCVTVPLGLDATCHIGDCLDEYTKLEDINEVDCPKCTLVRAEGQLKQMVPSSEDVEETENFAARTLSLPPELRILAAKRLEAIRHALENDDFADKTLNDACQIPRKAHVSTTKTRQAVIGRAPQSLVVHVNRSVFDEMTGVQRKNYANVRYPMVLNLAEWMLSHGSNGHATRSMLEDAQNEDVLYRLRAVVTHYGRHENGHYICYRRHPLRPAAETDDDSDADVDQREQWWRLSDEDVSAVTEDNVLDQGGVFMLFYEREAVSGVPKDVAVAPVELAEQADTPIQGNKETVQVDSPADNLSEEEVNDNEQPSAPTAESPALPMAKTEASPLRASDTEVETQEDEVVERPTLPRKLPSAPLMRTSYGRQGKKQGSMVDKGFGTSFRAVTAS
ncbi:ubiquitin-specific protease ubp1 [Elasticomyces elasticus]|nr:ubiquitin-specific protease ubp1 [Elasticomyces elasticus]KAK3653807.1 ubiquitin-specific protease ubp1 [Elasticomyces elasticus]KAK4916009.1 ubiquitin-specific protease ubp1 [Elasticomyces elasticus]KAK5755391.1 ubiquitin-specific protease ubp1 [Elasticomyces elasticus]